MLCVISPAKKLDFTNAPQIDGESPAFENKAKELIKELKKLKIDDIAKLMKLSDNLSELNFNRYQSFKFPINKNNSKPAAFVFQGDTYQGLEFAKLNKASQIYAQKSLRILSGLYGILKPLDLMQEYRLEMGTRFAINDKKNLYQFWKTEVTNQLNNDLKAHKALVNCASNEYFDCVDKNQIKTTIITPVFKENKNGVLKIISFNAKRARGMMAKYIIENKITEPSDLKKFNVDNYKFDPKLSTQTDFVFTR